MSELLSRLRSIIVRLSVQSQQIRYVPRAFLLVWEAAPKWTVLYVVGMIIGAILPVANIYMTRAAINVLVELVGAKRVVFDPALHLPPLVGILVLMLLQHVLDAVGGYVRINLAEYVGDFILEKVQRKAFEMDMEFFETPESHDQLQRAANEAVDRPLGLLQSMATLISGTITMLAMIGVLTSFGWWVPLMLVVGAFPAALVTMVFTRDGQNLRREQTVHRRWLGYLNNKMIGADSAAELRVYSLGRHFQNTHFTIRRRIRDERMQLQRKNISLQIVTRIWALICTGGVLLWVVMRAMTGTYTLGDLSLLYQAINQSQGHMFNFVSGAGEIYRNLFFLDDLFSFLDVQRKIVDAPDAVLLTGLHQGIRVEGISYAYPQTKRQVLKGLNLEIRAGTVVAIVGVNGVGKSTLLKLLCRFYDPQQGRITWDGVDLRNIVQADVWRRITVVFQRPVAYPESARTNILLGDVEMNATQDQIEQAARAADIDDAIQRLPQGYDTILGRMFGKAEFSGGQWQRLALARAFLRKADLVIFDEPTSSMDSWAEADFMTRLRNLIRGRTALMITHRFTTAMQADVIHVMHDGMIIESGTHAELVSLGGRYAESWRRQMRDVMTEASDDASA